jgi:hypothetical protein
MEHTERIDPTPQYVPRSKRLSVNLEVAMTRNEPRNEPRMLCLAPRLRFHSGASDDGCDGHLVFSPNQIGSNFMSLISAKSHRCNKADILKISSSQLNRVTMTVCVCAICTCILHAGITFMHKDTRMHAWCIYTTFQRCYSIYAFTWIIMIPGHLDHKNIGFGYAWPRSTWSSRMLPLEAAILGAPGKCLLQGIRLWRVNPPA